MENWEQGEQHEEIWDSFPSYQTPVMQYTVHPVTAEVPPGYDGTELFKERLGRDRLKDPETGVEYLLSTLRPYFVTLTMANLSFSAGFSDAPLQSWPDRLPTTDGQV